MRLYSDDQVAEFTRDGWWTGATWVDQFDARVRSFGPRISLVDPLNRETITDGAPRRLTWDEAATEVDQLARALHRAGVRQGDVVGVQLPNIIELAMAYIAVAKLGAITCPFPIQYAQHELTQMGTMAGLRAFVTVTRANKIRLGRAGRRVDRAHPDAVDRAGLGQRSAGRRRRARCRPGRRAGDAEYRAYLDTIELDQNDCVTLCWTSGTEGVPKGVPRAHGDWQAISSARSRRRSSRPTMCCSTRSRW